MNINASTQVDSEQFSTSAENNNISSLNKAIALSQQQALTPVSLGLGILYAIIALGHALLLEEPSTRLLLTGTATATSIIFLAYYVWSGYNTLSPRYAHLVGGIFAIIGSTNGLLHIALTGEPKQTTNLMLIIMALGSFFLSWPWFVSSITLILTAWATIVVRNPDSGDWVHFGFGLGMAVIASYVIHNVRYQRHEGFHLLRIENENRRNELEGVQSQLEARVSERTAQLSRLNSNLAAQVVQRRRIEEALRTSEANLKVERESLAKRVGQQTSELRLTNAELTRANRLKDEFLATMSHELRTPLNSILGNTEILSEQLVGPINDRQSNVLSRVDQSARHLLNLINDILDVSKIGAGKLTLDIVPIGIKSMCEGSLSMIRPNALKKLIDVSFQIEPEVDIMVGDGRRLKQVLVNLLSNAVKFTPDGGRIGLVARGFPEKKQIHFAVWDTGIGMSIEDQAHLFEPFVQADGSLARQHEGTGLGLALSKQLVQLHSGEIRVKSEVGKGSIFIVILPWRKQIQDESTVEAPELEASFEELATHIEGITSVK